MKRYEDYASCKKSQDRYVHGTPRPVNSTKPDISDLYSNNAKVSGCQKQSKQCRGRKEANDYETPLAMAHGQGAQQTDGRLHVSNKEQEYHSVKSLEDSSSIVIRPPLPILPDTGYVDRQCARMASPWESRAPPKVPARNTQPPAINRDLKPSRLQRLQSQKVPVARGAYVDGRSEPVLIPKRSPKEAPRGLLSEAQAYRPKGRSNMTYPPIPSKSIPSPAFQQSVNHQNGQRQAPIIPPRQTQDLEFRKSLDTGFFFEDNTNRFSAAQQPKICSNWQQYEKPRAKDDINVHKYTPRSRPVKTYDSQDWYINDCDRAEAEHALRLMNQDGVFLVRDRSKCTMDEPYVLALLQDKKVYNIKIRFIKDSRKYALGTGMWTNDLFDSVSDIIKFHMVFPINLIDGKNHRAEQRKCTLTRPITREKMNQILS